MKVVNVNVSGVLAVGGEGVKEEVAGARRVGRAGGEVYGEFGRRVRERFWWVREVTVRGPRGVGEREE